MLQNLSYNVLGVILKFLESKEIIRSGLVCKKLHEVAQMDHIWRAICLQEWPFIRHRFDESWKSAFKRKVLSTKGMKHGAASEYMMIPLRAHKGYVTAIQSTEYVIISGDSEGQLIAWFEDESKYFDEDPEPFSPIMFYKSVGKINEIIIHPSGNYISTVAFPNVITIFSFSPGERKIEFRSQITSDLPTVAYAEAYMDNVIAFPPSAAPGNILVYSCEDGKCTRKIPYKGIQAFPHFGLFNFEEPGKNLYAVWNEYLFFHYNQQEGHATKHYVEKINLKTQKTAGTIEVDPNCKYINVTGRNLFISYDTRFLVYDAATLNYLTAYVFPQVFPFDHGVIASNGPMFTLHFIKRNPFNLATVVYDMKIKNVVKTITNVDKEKGHKELVNSVHAYENNLVTASADMTIAVWDLKTGKHLYRLLGGSKLVKVKSFVENPTAKGFSLVRISESRVVGVLGNWIRVYAFDITPKA